MSGFPVTSGNATQIQGVGISSNAPSTNQVLEYNGTQWIPTTLPAGGGALSTVVYAPAGNNSQNLTNVTAQLFSLTSSSFTVPSSGNILVTVSGWFNSSASVGTYGWLAVRNHSTLVQVGPASMFASFALAGNYLNFPFTTTWAITGLTGGSTLQLDLMGFTSPNNGVQVAAGPGTAGNYPILTWVIQPL